MMTLPRNLARSLVRLSRSASLAIPLAAALLIAACGPGGPANPPTSDGIRVVATTTVFADIIRNVAGDRVDVDSIVPPGVGPEDFEPKPDDARLLSGADLVVSNGVGLDDFLADLLESGSDGSTRSLVLGEGIPALTDDGEANPHFWLDPTLVRDHYVPRIAAALGEVDPANAAEYEANAAAYAAELETLDDELQAKVDSLPAADRKLVTFHDAFPYFAQHFGFELVGVILENVGQEPTASELAALVEQVRAAKVKAVFSEAQFSPELSATLAREAGIQRVVSTLYTDSLGDAPADSYLGLMRWNVDQIVEALQ
jgi:ABC-type Zn uptake system ZnuABC Zn-binding protein ZnuA